MVAPDRDGDEAEGSRGLAGAVEYGPGDEVVLWVRLAGGDPLSGSIGDVAQSASFPFHGWIDFMSAINALRHHDGKP